jgi:hypothetical protein
MSEAPKKPDEGPIDWSSSPSTDGTRSPASTLFVEPAAPPFTAPASSAVESFTIDPDDDPEGQMRQVRAAQLAQHRRGHADPEPSVPTSAKLTRSPFASLVHLAVAGYLSYIGFACYQELGALHARAERAEAHELDTIRVRHQRMTHYMLLNAGVAAPFVIGAALLLSRRRGAALLFRMVGIVALIYLLYWSASEGQALVQNDDVLVKLIALALVAWIRPPVPSSEVTPSATCQRSSST